MPKVLLIDPALAVAVDRFRQILPTSVEIAATTSFEDDELTRLAVDADILVNARRRIDTAMLAMAPRARFIQLIGIGYDTVDIAAVASAGIVVAYNPGVNATGVAEQTLTLMLALVKRLSWSEQSSRAGQFATAELIGAGIDDLAGATVGLIGMGDIGTAVAERLIPFGPRIVYSTRARRPPHEETRLGATWLPLADLLRESTIVSLHLPLTPATYHLLGDEELAAMPKGSYLINTARGGLVDEAALRQAVLREHLRGAALDVLEHETNGRNPFADLPAVIVTPHLGGGSRGSVTRMVERSTANIGRFLAGEPIRDVIPGLSQTSS
jgi:phosphoglycerate dehydrogenase-like enzyme